MRIEDPKEAPPGRDPSVLRSAVMGFHPTRDGRHVLLHPSFPPGTERILRALGCPAEREAVQAACLSKTAQEIEDAVAAERGCAGVVRTPEEWDASEQGRLLASRPPVEVIKIGDSPPEPLPAAGDMPLSGVRVLDMTRVLAGPTCARTLAQYGADVLYLASPKLPASTGFLPDTNHGKLSAWLDLAEPGGPEQLRALLAEADVFSQGYRTGAMERMGFGPAQLAALRPGIVYTSINCYGHEGPWRGRAGWEQLAQTVTGMAHVHGGAAGPQLQPGAVTDYTTGFLAAFGSLIALQRRALYGGSYLVRVSLCQTGMWVQEPRHRRRGSRGERAEARGRRGPRIHHAEQRRLRADEPPAPRRSPQSHAGPLEAPGRQARNPPRRLAGEGARARRRVTLALSLAVKSLLSD